METLKEYKNKQRRNSKYRRELIRRATSSELKFRNILEGKGVKYIFQKGFIASNFHCIVDFYIPRKKICIEIDGGIHNSETQSIKDRMRDSYLINTRGFKVIRIKNEEVDDIEYINKILKI
jgi:very-short-patch-repair endonuclease